ncbi:hypothetical protein BDA96_03G186500 [Sorghum bicolor]|uniref:Uncharacterized protein n=1 Tax=Sorghum bicolor TaxID=4558 RepID=A0A921RDP6_SORBI|nr:hypothetical protein BDA96_03G186500 [Sorghum bicolor]
MLSGCTELKIVDIVRSVDGKLYGILDGIFPL